MSWRGLIVEMLHALKGAHCASVVRTTPGWRLGTCCEVGHKGQRGIVLLSVSDSLICLHSKGRLLHHLVISTWQRHRFEWFFEFLCQLAYLNFAAWIIKVFCEVCTSNAFPTPSLGTFTDSADSSVPYSTWSLHQDRPVHFIFILILWKFTDPSKLYVYIRWFFGFWRIFLWSTALSEIPATTFLAFHANFHSLRCGPV